MLEGMQRASWLMLASPRLIVLTLSVILTRVPTAATAPTDLKLDGFDSTVQALPSDSWAVVEFFASW